MERTAWECTRCHRINAPHVDRCDCEPTERRMTYEEVRDAYFPRKTSKDSVGTPYDWWHPGYPYRITVTSVR